MKLAIKSGMVVITASVLVSACSHQQVAPEPVAMTPPVVDAPVPVPVMPAPKPYPDQVVQPAPMKPAPLPAPVVKPRPAPVVKPKPAPVVVQAPKPVYVPPVKAKGNYRGSIPIAQDLRQQYQQ